VKGGHLVLKAKAVCLMILQHRKIGIISNVKSPLDRVRRRRTMTAQTSQGVASRLGYGLGQAARLVWCSQNRTLRWVKRLVVAAVLLYFSADIFSGIISVAVFTLVLGGGLWALNHRPTPRRNQIEYGQCYGPDGYGYYVAGQRVDDDD
tara:strand:+ start:750 stop:1196 length:447 start_codon:yes stop_codon:yes gene_type:complete